MNTLSERLSRFKGFIEGTKVDEFFQEFNVKFGAGTWAAGDFSDRFNISGYFPDLPVDLKSRLKRIYEAGIEGVTLLNVQLMNSNYEVDWKLVGEVKEYMAELGLKSAGLALDISGIPKWKLGSVTNPDERLREGALKVLLEGLELAKGVGANVASLWPG